MFRDLHPSSSAGDGKTIIQAKYNYPTDRPDHHRLCAMCGWNFDDDTNAQGDTLLSPGIQYAAPKTLTVNLPVPAGAAPISYQYKSVEPNVVSGCPFCGTFAPDGALIGREFGSGVDITNQ
jgi:hypothetical protein